jgi:hypothetical protein
MICSLSKCWQFESIRSLPSTRSTCCATYTDHRPGGFWTAGAGRHSACMLRFVEVTSPSTGIGMPPEDGKATCVVLALRFMRPRPQSASNGCPALKSRPRGSSLRCSPAPRVGRLVSRHLRGVVHAQHLRRRDSDAPHHPKPGEKQDRVVARVYFPPEEALPRRDHVVMMIVVPALPQRQQGERGVVS